MKSKAVQDYYPDDVALCYGCGRLNEYGHQLKSYWDGNETIARFTPKEYHTAIQGFVYGGLIASLIDCHGTGSAALAAYKNENRDIDSLPAFRFVTASLQVDYLKPTPIGVELVLRGKIVEVKGRKVITEITVSANGEITAKGKVIAVQIPENFSKE
ncbi:MAG TPA: PaaI family thioesterase [Ignavibacteriaceae bacterium]|jgi:acyl-coenzyme A thioesterase PaaI-like protein|nr:MAG: Thioesterase superfamily protein [Ignavibacteria bacterium ADurb.Bin266]OQY73742.1 MAG: thioesterase [Ignavibacteriales bacterium UTCHB2]HQF43367.1 PaaI family thioesterase [Ignavibacteriaceae bacterium]HQI40958.1 PaaI family thioesterase [Ignavibacteriaceae bacterium]HQJ47342.1 PaaI family thioesterase [Ignavibacteriaceae bacterium]